MIEPQQTETSPHTLLENTEALVAGAQATVRREAAAAREAGVSTYFGDADGNVFERRADGVVVPASKHATIP